MLLLNELFYTAATSVEQDKILRAILGRDGGFDRDFDPTKIVAAVRDPRDLLGPAVDIGQSVAVQVDIGRRILGIGDRPHRLHAVELLQGFVSSAPTRAETVGAPRGEADGGLRAR